MSFNFAFLESKFPHIAKNAAVAEEQVDDHSASALRTMRPILEEILRIVLQQEGFQPPKGAALAVLLGEATRRLRMPKDVSAKLDLLRHECNESHHSLATVAREKARARLVDLHDICCWFYGRCGDDPVWQPEEYVHPHSGLRTRSANSPVPVGTVGAEQEDDLVELKFDGRDGTTRRTARRYLQELDRQGRAILACGALESEGLLPMDQAVRAVARHLLDQFDLGDGSVRAGTELWAKIESAIRDAVRVGCLFHPRRGYVSTFWGDADDYSNDQWEECITAVLDTNYWSREDLIREAADWARSNHGLEWSRLDERGPIYEGLKAAITRLIRRGVLESNGSGYVRLS
jgi:hypothetical protein